MRVASLAPHQIHCFVPGIPPFLTEFVGRAAELAELCRLLDSRQANLVIVEGCRRIGKSRLVEEFGRGEGFLQFVGLAPTPETTAQIQRDEFSRLLSSQTDLPKLTSDDWGSLFQLLARKPLRDASSFSSMRFPGWPEVGVTPSIGAVGDAYDNAMAESFFATLERELLSRRKR